MPYIEENSRERVDVCINELLLCIKSTLINKDNINTIKLDSLSNNDVVQLAGVLNYCITRIMANVCKDISYSKIAIITGVLENIKQEFYRRLASAYEDKKIIQNGDIKEYKKI